MFNAYRNFFESTTDCHNLVFSAPLGHRPGAGLCACSSWVIGRTDRVVIGQAELFRLFLSALSRRHDEPRPQPTYPAEAIRSGIFCAHGGQQR